MGSGCFSPAPAHGDLDIEILEGLYEEATSTDPSLSYKGSKMLKAHQTIK